MNHINLSEIEVSKSYYKGLKNKFETPFRTSLKSKIRILLGVSKYTNNSDFDKKLSAISEENWRVAWARFYDFNFKEKNFKDWFNKIGIDLFILSVDNSEKAAVYRLLSSIYKGTLINYTKGLISPYHDNKMYCHQKSVEITEHTIFKVLEKIDTWSPYKAGFLTWMYTIARNNAFSKLKKTAEKTVLILDRETNDEEMDQDKMACMKSTDLTPEERYERENTGKLILEKLFKCSGYPWQILCVMMMKLDYKPLEIIAEYSDKTLYAFYDTFSKAFITSSFRSSEELEELLSPLKKALDQPLDELIFRKDSKTRKKLEEHIDQRCGEMHLKEFFGNNANKNISDWNARSLSRLRKELYSKSLL